MKIVNCPDPMLLDEFIADGLSTVQTAAVERHLQRCSPCRTRIAEIEQNLRILNPIRTCLTRDHAARTSEASRPRAIGGYQIVREIGRGGMGVVYEAQQAWPRRCVALKVLRGSFYADEYQIKLFRREVRALSRLKHRSIASIYDAGHTEDGAPFFAMEMIQGVPLNVYAQQHATPDRQRLTLIREVCAAINYAHQQGVIHRDIKPSNILVQGDGLPKVLDFGLARVVDAGTTAVTAITVEGKLHGTLPYMSPERIRGNPQHVDLRSDVYSLGVILYELMTGSLPFSPEDRSRQDLVDLICRGDLPRPGSLNRNLSSELEAIILKAVEKDVGLRYQSPLALSEDLERLLTDQPILARPPSTFYQLRKLLVRHKLGSAMAALLLLLVMSFSIGMGALYARARTAEQRAEELLTEAVTARDDAGMQAQMHELEAARSKQVTAFLQRMLASVDPNSGERGNVTIRQMVDEASLRLSADLGRYPETEAALRATLGSAYIKLGLMTQAEEHLQAALAIRRRLFGSQHLAVGDSLLRLARMYEESGNISKARSLCQDFQAMDPARLGNDSIAVASARLRLADLLDETGDLENADRIAADAMGVLQAELPEDHPVVAAGMRTWATVRYNIGDYESARKLAESALAVFDAMEASEPAEEVQTLQLLSWIVRAQGDFQGAESISRKALATCRDRLGEEHPWVASCLFGLAHQRYDLGFLKEAEALFDQSLAANRAYYDDDSLRVYDSLNGLAGMRWAQGDYAAAERMFREALFKTRQRLGGMHPRTAGQMNTLAVVLRDQGNFEEAEPLFLEALRLNRQFYGPRHRNTANILANLARMNYLKGNYAAAETLIREALEIRKEQFNARHPEVAECLMILGLILTQTDDATAGTGFLEEALSIRKEHFSSDHWLVAEGQSALADGLIALGEFDQARILLVDSLAVFTAQLNCNHKLIRQACARLARLQQLQGDAEGEAPAIMRDACMSLAEPGG